MLPKRRYWFVIHDNTQNRDWIVKYFNISKSDIDHYFVLEKYIIIPVNPNEITKKSTQHLLSIKYDLYGTQHQDNGYYLKSRYRNYYLRNFP